MMRNWFLCFARLGRRPPPVPPASSPGFDFDALAREVAAGLSRREAMRRLGVGLAGAALASLGVSAAAPAAAQTTTNSACLQGCDQTAQQCQGVCQATLTQAQAAIQAQL